MGKSMTIECGRVEEEEMREMRERALYLTISMLYADPFATEKYNFPSKYRSAALFQDLLPNMLPSGDQRSVLVPDSFFNGAYLLALLNNCKVKCLESTSPKANK